MARRHTKRTSLPPVSRISGEEGPNSTFVRFSFDEYMDLAINGSPKPGSKSCDEKCGRTSRRAGAEWSGTSSWEECIRLATDGWPEGREKMSEIVARLDNLTAGSVVIPQPVLDVTGDYVDIGAFLQGVPENMVKWEDREVQKRIARILFNGGVSGAVSTKVMEWKGAAVLALIDRLESQGVRVELDIFCGSASAIGDFQDVMIYNAKKAEDPLHIDRMAFHLVNPSSLRRLSFAACENLEPYIVNRMKYYDGGAYGRPLKVDDKLASQYSLVVPEFYLYNVDDCIKAVERMFDIVCQAEEIVTA